MSADRPAVRDLVESLCRAVDGALSSQVSIRVPRQFQSRKVFNTVMSALNSLGVVRVVTNKGSRLMAVKGSVVWEKAKSGDCGYLLKYVYDYLCRSGFSEYC